MGKTFQGAQVTHEIFLTIDHSCKIFFWYLPNWTSTNLCCVVQYITYSLADILQEWSMVKNLSCVSCAAWNIFPINSLRWGFAINTAKKTPMPRSLLRSYRKIQAMEMLKIRWRKKLRPKWRKMPSWKETWIDGLPWETMVFWLPKTKMHWKGLKIIKRTSSNRICSIDNRIKWICIIH